MRAAVAQAGDDPAQLANLAKKLGLIVFVISELARMTAHDAPGEALPLYDEALRLHVTEKGRSLHDDIELLQNLTDAAVRAHRPGEALAWFDRMPEAAAQLVALRRQLGGAPSGHR